MKTILFVISFSLSAIFVSCGQNKDGQKKKTAEDSINKIDSITKLLIGSWKEEGKNTYIKIEKAGELFTVTSNTGLTYAYKLSGQILNPVDKTGSTYSLIGTGGLLKGSIKYTKVDKDISATSSKSDSTNKTNTTSIKGSKTSSSTSSSVSSSTTAITTTSTTTTTTTIPKELSIYGDNVINLFQSASTTSTIIRGLTNGQVCKIIAKGSKEVTIAGKTDYWYKVKAEGDIGWVFGSYTSLRK